MPVHDEGFIDYYGDGRTERMPSIHEIRRRARENREKRPKSDREINREKIAALIKAFVNNDVEKQDNLLAGRLNLNTEIRKGEHLSENMRHNGQDLFINSGEQLNIWKCFDRLNMHDAMIKMVPYYSEDMRVKNAHDETHSLPIHLILEDKSDVVLKMFEAHPEFAETYAVEAFKLLTPANHEKNKLKTRHGHLKLLCYLVENHFDEISKACGVTHRILNSQLPDRSVTDHLINTHPETVTDPEHGQFVAMEKLFNRWHMSISTVQAFFERCDAAKKGLNVKNRDGETILFRLAMMPYRQRSDEQDDMAKRTDLADFLIEYGADPHVTDKRDWTILDRLSMHGDENSPMVKLLYAHGAGYHKQISPKFSGFAQRMQLSPGKISVQKKPSKPEKTPKTPANKR